MSGVTITFPLTDAQATSIIVAADAFGVEAWEMAAHVLKIREPAQPTEDPDA